MSDRVIEQTTSPLSFEEQPPNWLPYIPYNGSNKERASENRRPMTKAERKVRFGILRERPGWYKFIRQKMIDAFILDFYCSKLLLGIEIDGPSHDKRKYYDAIRTEKIWHRWIKIIRYTNEDVFYNLDRVSQDLVKELNIRAKQLGFSNPPSASADTSSLIREASRNKTLVIGVSWKGEGVPGGPG